jgi:hypothetical protein
MIDSSTWRIVREWRHSRTGPMHRIFCIYVPVVDFSVRIWYTKSIQSQESSGHKLITSGVGVYGFSISIKPGNVARLSDGARNDIIKTLGAGSLLVFFLYQRC